MQIDVSLGAAASAAAPPPDASSASAEAPTGAAALFAALLDQAAGTSAQSTPAKADNDEDALDELASWMTPSLWFMQAFAPVLPTLPGGEGEIPVSDEAAVEDSVARAGACDTAGAMGEIAQSGIAAAGLPTQGTGAIGDHIGAAEAEDGAATKEATAGEGVAAAEAAIADGKTVPAQRATGSIDAATRDAATSSISSPSGEALGRREITADGQGQAAKADGAVPGSKIGDTTAAVKANDGAQASTATRASKPSRGGHSKPEQKAAVALAAALADAQATTAAAPIADAVQASARNAAIVDVQTPGATAARFARALERAAALSVTESGEGPAAASAAPAGQQSPFGESTPDEATERFGAVRQAANAGMTFTITAPTPIDARTIATTMAGATLAAGAAPGSIPERDVVAQLVQSMRLQFRDGIGEAVVKLRPDHLGSVQISLRIENGAIRATVQAELPAVRQWLESQQETLKSSLADQGLRLERFVVEPDGERQAAQHDAERERQQRRRHQHQEESADQPVFEVLA